ncbi:phosphate-starvation-inducible PsiE family protein [Citrobacter sp. CK190]|uniref:phosphate-starvation-inducible PsiE family protein n=1 Tax=Citrobacter sp. CK190 TaxID=2985099 RepID=UPI00336C2EFC
MNSLSSCVNCLSECTKSITCMCNADSLFVILAIKYLFLNFGVFMKKKGILLLIAILTIIFLLLLLFAKLNFNVNTALAIFSLILTVLSGTDFIKKHTSIKSTNKSPIDMWMVFSVAITAVSMYGLYIDPQLSPLEILTICIVSLILLVTVLVSAFLNYRKIKKPDVREIIKQSHSVFRESEETITITTTIKKAP